MARLDQLTDGFMESFLRNNPKSVVDSNGYLRSEYEEELARRAAIKAQPQVEGVPDPRSFQPQFQDIPEFEPAVDALFDAPVAEQAAPIIEKSKVDLQAAYDALMADTGWKGDGPLIVPATQATNVILTPAPEIPEGQPRLRIIAEPLLSPIESIEAGLDLPEPQEPTLGEDQKYAVVPDEIQSATPLEAGLVEPDGADVHNDHE